jgi:hypothetical protein
LLRTLRKEKREKKSLSVFSFLLFSAFLSALSDETAFVVPEHDEIILRNKV